MKALKRRGMVKIEIDPGGKRINYVAKLINQQN